MGVLTADRFADRRLEDTLDERSCLADFRRFFGDFAERRAFI
jgi:hypothetical protein